MANEKRDYRQEYREYHGSLSRSPLGLREIKSAGDPREVDHKNPISNGGSNRQDNLRVVSQETNRSKGGKTKL